MKKQSLFLLALLSVLASCGVKTLSLQVQRPAQVAVPADIKKILIINRTKPTTRSTLDGVLTGEFLNQDKGNVEECLNGLQSTLGNSSRFQVSRASEYLQANAVKNFSAPLNWSDVETFCRKYGTDGVLSLEFFDTDFILTNGKRSKVASVNGKDTVKTTVFWVKGVGQVKAGFRIYDPKRKSIAYENRFDVANNWETSAATLAEATAQLISKDRAVREISGSAGRDFANQIIPLFVWESREYYKGKHETMQRGARLATTNQWNEAIDAWKSVINSGGISSKEKGKAAFNIALGYEVLGNLPEAQRWVRDAYVNYGNKNAQRYSNTIERQIENQRILEQQRNAK